MAAFERIVKDTNVAGVMGAYNAFLGDPCCASDRLINQILRTVFDKANGKQPPATEETKQ